MTKNEAYLNREAFAYNGVYQRIGELPGIDNPNQKVWTMLGALLLDLHGAAIREVVIYNDSRLVEEWNDEVSFINPASIQIHSKIRKELINKFFKVEIRKLDSATLNSKIEECKLAL